MGPEVDVGRGGSSPMLPEGFLLKAPLLRALLLLKPIK